MNNKLLYSFLLSLSLLTAGTTGKIAGTVTDSQTGEPLIGANIIVDGTSMGTASTVDGSYFILNVPPGTYTVRCMMIGYGSQRITEVSVAVDLTTTLDFDLNIEAIQGAEITVVAERPTVRLDQTSMASVVSSEEIENLPVAEIGDLVELQAGVTRDPNGGLHVRGGRSGEISFWVDGVSITDSYDNSVGQEVENSSIQEIQVISGTFNAEYGKSMSGIVNVVTKDGGKEFEGGLEVYGGGFHTSDSDLYSLSDPFSSWVPYTDLNGNGIWDAPEWFNDLNRNLIWDPGEPFTDSNNNGVWDSGEPLNNDLGPDGKPRDPSDNGSMIPSNTSNNNGQKNEPSFGEGDGTPQWGEHEFALVEGGYVDKLNVAKNPFQIKNINAFLSGPIPFTGEKVTFYASYRNFNTQGRFYGRNLFTVGGGFGDRSIVSMSPFEKTTGQVKLTFVPIPKLKFAYNLMYGSKEYKNYDSFYKYNPSGLMNRYENDMSHILSATHTLSERTYYEVKFVDFSTSYEEYLYKDIQNIPYGFKYLTDRSWEEETSLFFNGVDTYEARRYLYLDSLNINGQPTYLVMDMADEDGYVDPRLMNMPEWSFGMAGTQGGRFSRSTKHRGMKFDLSSQINFSNLVKMGIEYKEYEISADDKSVEAATVGDWGRSPSGDTLGFNPLGGGRIDPYFATIHPTHSTAHDYFVARPKELSAYIQDKLELNDIILNVGVRLDYFDPDWVVPTSSRFPGNKKYYVGKTANDTVVFWEHEFSTTDEFYLDINGNGSWDLGELYLDVNGDGNYSEMVGGVHPGVVIVDSINSEGAVSVENMINRGGFTQEEWEQALADFRWKYGYKRVKPSYQISPRIGLSYPITDKGAIHVSYGYFFQIPNFQYLYSNPEFEITDGNIGGILGNADLKPEKTVMYEIGIKQEIAPYTAVDFTVYYRDTRDWVGISAPISKYPVGTYSKYENKDYANNRGVTIQLSRAFHNGFGASIDYSWMVAEGTYSNPDDAYFSAQDNEAPLQALIPLDWDQTHTLNGSVSVGGKNWMASLIGKYWTGTPYTPVFSVGTVSGSSAFSGLKINSDRKPSYAMLDLRTSYGIEVAGLDFTLYCNVYNLLDIRNERTIWGDTGRATSTLTAKDVPETHPDRIGTLSEHLLKPDWFSEPRKINIGFNIGF